MRPRLSVPMEGRDRVLTPHKGLVLDRYIADTPQENGHASALRALTRISSCDTPYKLAFERWQGMVGAWGENTVRVTGTIRGRMALGLGIESVLEIGCRLHSTYGVPVIPGSSLKGALRAHIEAEDRYTEEAKLLFGSLESAGYAEVFDAWWIPEATKSGLSLDVLTVHHQDYYSGVAPPGDSESPIPVSFLTVTGKFLFTVRAPNKSWAGFVDAALRDLLTEKGIGAKRSAGYGRFRLS